MGQRFCVEVWVPVRWLSWLGGKKLLTTYTVTNQEYLWKLCDQYSHSGHEVRVMEYVD